jgi:acyl carrier protein
VSAEVLDRIRPIFAALFNVPASSVGLATSQQDLAAWDSLGHLNLVLELEQEFGISLAPEEVERMSDVATILNVIETARE